MKHKYNLILTKKFLIHEYIKNKKSGIKIAKENKCGSSTVFRYLKKYNIKTTKGNFKDGRTLAKHYCIENCGRELKGNSAYLNKRCQKCYHISQIGRKISKETKKKMSLSAGGTGIPYENSKYPQEFFTIRIKILKRDKYICQVCLKKGSDIHHIDYNKTNCQEDNLITTCHFCNIHANKNKDYWYVYFTYILDNRIGEI
jgi:hypothetical protein